MFLTSLAVSDKIIMVPLRLKRMVTDGFSLDITVNTAHISLKGGMLMEIVLSKGAKYLLQIIQATAQVVVAVMAIAQFVLKLIEYFKHKKSNRPDQG